MSTSDEDWDSHEALLARWREGDMAALRSLLEQVGPSLVRFFRNKVGGGAEDLVQETFTRLLPKRDDIRDGGSLRHYVFGIARNVWYEHLRKQGRRGEEIEFDEEVSLEQLSPGQTTIVARRQEHRLMLEGFRRLPLEHQFLIELHLIEGLTYDVIAGILDTPSGTLRSRMRDIRMRLSAIIEKLEAEPGLIASTIQGIDTWAAEIRAQLGRNVGDQSD